MPFTKEHGDGLYPVCRPHGEQVEIMWRPFRRSRQIPPNESRFRDRDAPHPYRARGWALRVQDGGSPDLTRTC
jgi:hypothetical protein